MYWTTWIKRAPKSWSIQDCVDFINAEPNQNVTKEEVEAFLVTIVE
jgi:hypothetical protein